MEEDTLELKSEICSILDLTSQFNNLLELKSEAAIEMRLISKIDVEEM